MARLSKAPLPCRSPMSKRSRISGLWERDKREKNNDLLAAYGSINHMVRSYNRRPCFLLNGTVSPMSTLYITSTCFSITSHNSGATNTQARTSATNAIMAHSGKMSQLFSSSRAGRRGLNCGAFTSMLYQRALRTIDALAIASRGSPTLRWRPAAVVVGTPISRKER